VRHSTPALALRHARQQLIEHGTTPPGAINERLARSWQRSLEAGLLPMGRLSTNDHANAGELRHALARNHELLAHSRPVMEYLFEQVRHSQSVVILADSHSTIMHTLGDAYFLNKAARVALATGASWHEQHRGTNAIGTALAEKCAVEIHGAEHFLERNGFLTCAAAPIMASCGKLLGVLDITGDQHNGHPHTLGLVSMAARMIENRLLVATCRRDIRLHLHAHAEGIGTVAEGIIAISEEGLIIGANRIGLALLQLDAANIGSTSLSSVLDIRLDELLSRHQRRPGQAMQLHGQAGSTLFVQVQSDPGMSPAIKATPVAAPQEAVMDALSCLDTGDLRWRNASDKARRVLDKPIPILIQGDSGVGKEYFARAAHDSSARRAGPFVAINCAAIPEHLIEAELFGYAPGAFTGAKKEGSLGRLREAHHGTLFLDEIGDMPLNMQTRLLRVLQERSVTPLGDGRAIEVDFALICATHCKLREAAEQGTFRSDLYYRINGLTIQLPPLRERTDFQALAERLLASLNPGQEIHLAAEVLGRMSTHSWPGNLRQLASVLRTASAMLDAGQDCIDWHHLPDDIAEELLLPQAAPGKSGPGLAAENLDDISRSAIRQALENSRGNISMAARKLGISRQTLYRKLKPA
jgi:transcriptional regulator of acetoin/glycerol metabolism